MRILLFLFLMGCTISPTDEDRKRVDELTRELKAMNAKLEEYKERIDRLNRNIEALTRMQGK